MEPAQRRAITRNRELLACTECRRRKLKCDRNVPCTSCQKRGDQTACTYQRFAKGAQNERERRIQAESKLAHLEQLVRQLSQGDTSGRQSTAFDLQEPSAHDLVRTSNTQAHISDEFAYNGATHWSMMLKDIEELRFAIAPDDAFDQEDWCSTSSLDDGTEILFGAGSSLTLEQVLAQYLPARQTADRLVGAYIRSKTVGSPAIHATQFQRQYQQFWNNTLDAPILWISMLFSVLHIATNTLTPTNGSTDFDAKYSFAAAQCLTIGKYYKPQPLCIEALLLFAQAKCLTGLEVTTDIGTIFGLLIRLATRMGYHRDPAIFNLSAFEGEMRRRTWSMAAQLDLLISFQLGLPSNIQYPTWDSQAPSNLLDSDFDEHATALPPARPDSEATDILFYISKHKLMAVFEKVLRHSLSTKPPALTDPAALDAEIRSVYSAVPDMLQVRPISESVIDSASLIVTRLCVNLIYQKSLCVLHRRYVVQSREVSVRVCYEASSSIVRYILDTFYDFQPGGQFETERWFMGSLTWHDFLLGISGICLVLCAPDQEVVERVVDRLEAKSLLRGAQGICAERSSQNRDTYRVQRLVVATLLRFDSQEGQNALLGSEANNTSYHNGTVGPSTVSNSSRSRTTNAASLLGVGVNGNTYNMHDWHDWTHDAEIEAPVDDFSWTYLEHFLNLPSEDAAMNC